MMKSSHSRLSSLLSVWFSCRWRLTKGWSYFRKPTETLAPPPNISSPVSTAPIILSFLERTWFVSTHSHYFRSLSVFMSYRLIFRCYTLHCHAHWICGCLRTEFADEALYSWIMQGLITALHWLSPLSPSLEWSLAESGLDTKIERKDKCTSVNIKQRSRSLAPCVSLSLSLSIS